jgi:hypothetical protein
MKWRVEAQTLYVRTFEAETEEEAEQKMDELLEDCDYRDHDWCISAHKTCNGCKLTDEGFCTRVNAVRTLACKEYAKESEEK